MEIPGVRRPSAREVAFKHLVKWIEDGQLAPDEIVKDADIARQLGVSRTPVREALQMLEQLGLVVTLPYRHTRVAAAGIEDVGLLYPLLGTLMGFAAEVAVPGVTPDDLAAMRRANERLLRNARQGDAVATRRADHDFHYVLVERADNKYLSSVIRLPEVHARRLETIYFGELGPTQRSYSEHKDIMDAAAAGDARRAGDLTRANYERTARVLLSRQEVGCQLGLDKVEEI